MKIELNEKEMKYLRSAPFRDWKQVEIDAEISEIYNFDKVDFYKNLYYKLGGEE